MLPSAEVRGTPRPRGGTWVSPAPPRLLASLGLSSWDVGTGWRGEDSIEVQVSNSLSPVGKVRATPAFEVSCTTLRKDFLESNSTLMKIDFPFQQFIFQRTNTGNS